MHEICRGCDIKRAAPCAAKRQQRHLLFCASGKTGAVTTTAHRVCSFSPHWHVSRAIKRRHKSGGRVWRRRLNTVMANSVDVEKERRIAQQVEPTAEGRRLKISKAATAERSRMASWQTAGESLHEKRKVELQA